MPAPTHAAINQEINFQGKLTNPDGTNVADSSYSFVFSIYTVASGGVAVWSEAKSLSTTDGIFQTALGDTTPISGIDFNSNDLYLGIKVGADAEMSPRVQLHASPFAFNSDTLDGLDSDNLVQIAQGTQNDPSNSQTAISINKTGSANILDLQRNGSSVLVVDSNGTTTFTPYTSPSSDITVIDNSANPNTVAGVNGLNVNYVGGNAAIEASGVRIDYSPGATSGGVWNGLKIVANAQGASAGVESYGLRLEGPSVANGGTNTAVKIATGWDIGLDIGSGGLQLGAQDNPVAPAPNNLRVYAKNIAGRMLLKAQGPSGVDYPLQPSLFQNQVTIINAQTGTANGLFGTGRSLAGTASHPAATEEYGYMTNYATAATANSDAGVGNNATQFFRGSTNGANGYFFNVRYAMPDASYASGARAFIGMTSQSIANSVGSDDPNGNRSGFSFSTSRGDTNWQFSTKDGSTENLVDTGLAFLPQKAYDCYVYVSPQGSTIYWRIDNMTDGVSQEGSVTNNLPQGDAALRGVLGITTLSATSLNVRMQRMYIEADR